MTLRQVRERCEQIARSVPMPTPFDLEAFLADLGHDRGRPIYLLPFALPPGAPRGLCLPGQDQDYVVVDSAASGAQRVHIALHEVSHLLLGHELRVLDDGGIGQLFRHLDPAMLERMFAYARTTFSTVEEQEAETLASLLGHRAGLWRPPAPRAAHDPVVARLERSLEHGLETRGR